MDDRTALLVLAFVVLVMFSVNLWYSIQAFRGYRENRPDRRRAGPRLRAVINALIVWIGVLIIFVGRCIVAFPVSPDARSAFQVFTAAALSGALILGGALLVYSWATD